MILITGACGHIGREVCRVLRDTRRSIDLLSLRQCEREERAPTGCRNKPTVNATPDSELKNDPCQTRARSHATTAPPSNGTTCRSSASQKATPVSLGP